MVRALARTRLELPLAITGYLELLDVADGRDDHDPKSPLVAIKFAVAADPESPSLLPDARWQRCVVHFERNVLAHVPAGNTKNVADLGIRPRT